MTLRTRKLVRSQPALFLPARLAAMPSCPTLVVGLVGLEGEKMWSREGPAGQSLFPGVRGGSATGHYWSITQSWPSAPRTGAAILTLKAQSMCGPHNSSTHLQPLPLWTRSLGWWDVDQLESSALVQEILRVLRGGRNPQECL